MLQLPLILLLSSSMAMTEDDLTTNGSFELGLEGWTTSGTVELVPGGWDGAQAVRMQPSENLTAEAWQRITGLQPQTRYTVAARVWTSNHLTPPIVGFRNGPQIDKASGMGGDR